jgi:hypothetical protein
MEKKKKYKLSSTELIDLLIDKELEPYGVTCEEMRALPEGKINGVHWYQHYTFNTPEEYNAWKEFCIDILSKQITPKLHKSIVEREFAMLDLMWGLKRNYE